MSPDARLVDDIVVVVAQQKPARVVPSGRRLFAHLLAVRHSNADAQVGRVAAVDTALHTTR